MNKTQKQYAVIICWDDSHFMELLGATSSWEEALGYVYKRMSQEEYEYFEEAIYSVWSEHPNYIPKKWQEAYKNKEINLSGIICKCLDDEKVYADIYGKSIKSILDFYLCGEDESYRFVHTLKYKSDNPRTIDIRILIKTTEYKLEEINDEC